MHGVSHARATDGLYQALANKSGSSGSYAELFQSLIYQYRSWLQCPFAGKDAEPIAVLELEEYTQDLFKLGVADILPFLDKGISACDSAEVLGAWGVDQVACVGAVNAQKLFRAQGPWA